MFYPHRQILYLSHLVHGVRYEQFAAICNASRRRNAELQLGGVLLFDGYRFCALLQGPGSSVQAVHAAIATDPRHERMRVLADRSLPPEQPEPAWMSGYCDSEDLDRFESPDRLRADDALAAFQAVAQRAHLLP